MFKSEITLDDVIEFIIRNCDDRAAMDKISKTSFPFTTKYLNNNKEKERQTQWGYGYNIPNLPTNWTVTLCNNDEALSPNAE